MSEPIRPGDRVVLMSLPESDRLRGASMRAGGVYRVVEVHPRRITTTTDRPGETATYYAGRVRREGEES